MMKEVGKAKANGGTQGMRRSTVNMAAGLSVCGRTETDKEKTKMRERQRRAITTNIFHGLRKHGGYRLSPPADINEVLRQLATEAGWVVLADGTTYRSSSSPYGWGCCPVCGSWKAKSNSGTPSSTVVVGDGGEGGGGEYCSTTASPVRESLMNNNNNNNGGPGTDTGGEYVDQLCMYGGIPIPGGDGGLLGLGSAYPRPMYVQEARASNQNTPQGSPLRPA